MATIPVTSSNPDEGATGPCTWGPVMSVRSRAYGDDTTCAGGPDQSPVFRRVAHAWFPSARLIIDFGCAILDAFFASRVGLANTSTCFISVFPPPKSNLNLSSVISNLRTAGRLPRIPRDNLMTALDPKSSKSFTQGFTPHPVNPSRPKYPASPLSRAHFFCPALPIISPTRAQWS